MSVARRLATVNLTSGSGWLRNSAMRFGDGGVEFLILAQREEHPTEGIDICFSLQHRQERGDSFFRKRAHLPSLRAKARIEFFRMVTQLLVAGTAQAAGNAQDRHVVAQPAQDIHAEPPVGGQRAVAEIAGSVQHFGHGAHLQDGSNASIESRSSPINAQAINSCVSRVSSINRRHFSARAEVLPNN